jgi:hypothetical protein
MGLITKIAKVKWNTRTKTYYETKGYIYTKLGDEFDVKVEDLTEGSMSKVTIECDDCGKQIIKTYCEYNRYVHKDNKCYCQKCGFKYNKDERFKNMKETYKNKIYESKNEFKISDSGTYWIGTTQKGEEFWFDGNKELVEYIKSYTWRKTTYGYFQNRKGDKLHRVIMGVTDPNIFVNHLGGRRWDNRKEKLSISDDIDNSKEKKVSNRNSSGITGLIKRGRLDKWIGTMLINDINVSTQYKIKDEALIDLLIVQKHYGFRHNENLYYMLDDVSELRVKEVIKNIERQLNKPRIHKICSTNRFELSEDGTYYNVYDVNNKSFKISLESKELVERGIWYIADDINHDKLYVHGNILINNHRKTVKLHRYLFDLLDKKYKSWFIDHLGGDGLDNRLNNLVITDAQGNGINKPVKGYAERYGRWRVKLTIFGESFSETVDTEQEAIELVKQKREEAMKQRIEFHSRDELDTYLENLNLRQAI